MNVERDEGQTGAATPEADRIVVDVLAGDTQAFAGLVRLAERLRAEAGGNRDDSDAYVAALRGCRQSLPPRDAALVKMRYEKGLSFEAIAEAQGQTAEAVQRMISRIRFRLRDCIQNKL